MDRGEDGKKKVGKHPIRYELNPSSQLLFEENLKRCVAKYEGNKSFKDVSKYAPRNKHSPFGDFPPGYLPQKTQDFTLVNIDSQLVGHSGTETRDGEKNKRIFVSKRF